MSGESRHRPQPSELARAGAKRLHGHLDVLVLVLTAMGRSPQELVHRL